MTQQPTQIEQYQAQRIEALTAEIGRLNDVVQELENSLQVIETKANQAAKRAVISNPDFLKPISELEVDYEVVEPKTRP